MAHDKKYDITKQTFDSKNFSLKNGLRKMIISILVGNLFSVYENTFKYN